MQFQADLLGVPVVIPEIAETTALGAAYLAGVGSGIWQQEQVAGMWRASQTFEPRMGRDLVEELMADWHRALERSRGWAADRPE